jgi:RNA polymerase sigma factor (sigma-70 family)
MQSRDYGSGMRDSEVVAAIVAGDPSGLAEAYDKYAGPLYVYCRTVLHEHADAADAVQDTFVIAASRLAGLHDRDRLRPWLYAVARNECRRRLRIRKGTSPLDEALDVTDETADVSGDAERAELRALLRDAVRGLNPAEQEVIELQLRQGLDGTEVADVLGITRNHAHALISRARDQLEVCLGVLLVARAGRHNCAALSELLTDWNGELTVLLRKRLNRHVERCPVCSERRRRVLRPATLLGLAPIAALPLSMAAPPGLREQVLRLAASNRPEAVAHRASVAGRMGTFGHHGFPRPLDPPRPRWWQAKTTHVATGAAAVLAVASTVVATSGVPGHHPPVAAAGTMSVVSTGASSAGNVTPSGQPRSASAQAGAPSPSPSEAVLVSPPGRGQASASASASGSASRSASASASPGATSSSPAPAPPPPTSAAVAPGTLSVTPTRVVLSPLLGGSITITAAGGPVNWSVGEDASLLGKLTLSPSSGTLQAGQHATITITVNGLASLDTVVTINPGGHAVTVLLGLL